MNWSTRLRRWVRIRTPPVRVASMKPTAATVLPAPVACSNQKRRAAPGSSGASSTTSSSSSGPGSDQSCGSSSSGASSSSSPSTSASSSIEASAESASSIPTSSVSSSTAASAEPTCCLGHQLGERAGERVDLMRGELGAVAQGLRLDREEALQPEQHRVVAAPLDRRVLGARRELDQRGVERLPAGGAGRERLGPLAVEQERLAGERRRTLDIGARWDCRTSGNIGGVGHRRLWVLPRPKLGRRPVRGWNEGCGKTESPSPRELKRSANREPNVSVL